MQTFNIIVIIFAVLQIILFFKLWRMTNDVHRILNYLKRRDYKPKPIVAAEDRHQAPEWGIGCQVVKRGTEEVFTIYTLYGDGSIGCRNEMGCSKFRKEELDLLSDYLKNR
ncbi:hypothetical protein [Alistipes sp.]|uniref:hypothetical protein n=1 Tax=Alistipes sp. TaxID=1872444 RepID=UPI003AF16C26